MAIVVKEICGNFIKLLKELIAKLFPEAPDKNWVKILYEVEGLFLTDMLKAASLLDTENKRIVLVDLDPSIRKQWLEWFVEATLSMVKMLVT